MRCDAVPQRLNNGKSGWAGPVTAAVMRYNKAEQAGYPMSSTADTTAKPFARVEDNALIRGAGRYVDDVLQHGQTYACFVRSPHACASRDRRKQQT